MLAPRDISCLSLAQPPAAPAAYCRERLLHSFQLLPSPLQTHILHTPENQGKKKNYLKINNFLRNISKISGTKYSIGLSLFSNVIVSFVVHVSECCE